MGAFVFMMNSSCIQLDIDTDIMGLSATAKIHWWNFP